MPGGAPQILQVTAVSSTSITLIWAPPLLDLQNGLLRAYNISVTEVETGNVYTFATVLGTDNLFVVNALHPFYNYNCTVSAFTISTGPAAFVQVITLSEGAE